MIIFAPQSLNASHPCTALEQYEHSRPPRNEQIAVAFAVIYALFVALWLGSIVWFWRERACPRLSSVRPFWANLQVCVAHLLFSTFTALNLATDQIPCWFLLACLLFGLGGCAANFLMRMTLFVVESQFARLASAQKRVVDGMKLSKNDEDDGSSSYSSLQHRRTWRQKLYTHYEHIKLIVGLCSIEQISLVSISHAKSDVSLAMWFIVPLVVSFAWILIVSPTYANCSGCEVFAEMIIAFMLCLILQSFLSTRAAYIAWRAKFPDTQGLFKETFTLMFGCIPFAVVIVLLYVLDPNDVKFQRRFDFEWIICLLLLMYWYAAVGAQIVAVQQYKKRVQLHRKTHRHLPFSQAVIQAMTLEEEAQFREFTQKQFSIEHLNFAQDVIAFETYFEDRAENWRTSKARRIITTYIEPGSVMEINISYECRYAILTEFSAKADRVPADLFKSAMQQVVRSVLLGIWLDYSSLKKATTPITPVAAHTTPQSMFRKSPLI